MSLPDLEVNYQRLMKTCYFLGLGCFTEHKVSSCTNLITIDKICSFYGWVVCLYHVFFILFPIDEHLSYFHIVHIMAWATINSHTDMSVICWFSFIWKNVKNWACDRSIIKNLSNRHTPSSIMVVLIYILTKSVFLTSSPTSVSLF